MSGAKSVPVFNPWDGKLLVIRHHEDRERVARIAHIKDDPTDPELTAGWYLSWEHYLPISRHDTALEAVAAARDAYPAYLQAAEEEMREDNERAEYEARFVNRRANAVARAVRVPTGGQKGWQERRPSPPGAGGQ